MDLPTLQAGVLDISETRCFSADVTILTDRGCKYVRPILNTPVRKLSEYPQPTFSGTDRCEIPNGDHLNRRCIHCGYEFLPWEGPVNWILDTLDVNEWTKDGTSHPEPGSPA